jgi:hypothetical protein
MGTVIDIPREPLVRRPMAQEIATGIGISVYYGMKITPVDVARVLDAAKVKYVFVGAHAVNAYSGRPRATQDVDVLTDAPKKAAAAVKAAYPHLVPRETPVVINHFDGETIVLDVIKAKPVPLFRRLFKDAQRVELEGELLLVPQIEGVLAMKFKSMTSPMRPLLDRQQDAVDFAKVIVAADEMAIPIDLDRLEEFGELCYGGGGEHIVGHVADVRDGRMLQL